MNAQTYLHLYAYNSVERPNALASDNDYGWDNAGTEQSETVLRVMLPTVASPANTNVQAEFFTSMQTVIREN